ncbi:Uncharacterised protein [Vibrio cholerae]|nr:Uncharacterised protein [Vibrio cholerae]
MSRKGCRFCSSASHIFPVVWPANNLTTPALLRGNWPSHLAAGKYHTVDLLRCHNQRGYPALTKSIELNRSRLQ